MANVLNPEPESITLNTELETPTLDLATELEQPLSESTSNTETAELVAAVEPTLLDADAVTEPVAEAATQPTEVEAAAPVAEVVREVAATAAPEPEATAADVRELEAPAEGPPVVEAATGSELVAAEPAHEAHGHEAHGLESPHGLESMDDFSAALAAFEREQAAEAAAVEAYGDKVVSGTVIKATDKHLIVDVGLKSEGMVPLEQVLDHTGAVRFNAGDVIDVVIEREEPEGGYLVSFEKAQRLRVWDVIE